jgi:hypothetical protein
MGSKYDSYWHARLGDLWRLAHPMATKDDRSSVVREIGRPEDQNTFGLS